MTQNVELEDLSTMTGRWRAGKKWPRPLPTCVSLLAREQESLEVGGRCSMKRAPAEALSCLRFGRQEAER
jgi:hypothetical protein